MNQKQAPPKPAPAVGIGDIYYVLFRRKWLIIGFALAGFIAAGVTYFATNTPYQSVAKLWVEAVHDEAAPVDNSAGSMRSTDSPSGAGILNSEREILTSFDLAKHAAEAVGPAKIVADASLGTNVDLANAAAGIIRQNLVVDVGRGSSVMYIIFSHTDPTVVKPVLDDLITNYIKTHARIHSRLSDNIDYLDDQQATIQERLKTEEELFERMKTTNNVVSLDDEKRIYGTEKESLAREFDLAKAQFASSEAELAALQKMLPQNALPATNAATNVSVATPVPPSVLAQYKEINQNIIDLNNDRETKLAGYTTNVPRVQTNIANLNIAYAKKNELETNYPALTAVATIDSRPVSQSSLVEDPVATYKMKLALHEGLKSELNSLSSRLAEITQRGTNLNTAEALFNDEERKIKMDEEQFNQISALQERARAETAFGVEKLSSISEIDHPTPPSRDTKQLSKMVGMIAAGGLFTGLGLAFLLEMFLDRSLKRPQEVIAKLPIPFFLSLPYMNGNGRLKPPKADKQKKLLAASAESTPANPPEMKVSLPAPAQNGGVAAWDEKHALRPFHETLRDRLVAYFEMINLTHKPKLVAVTSCGAGAGVSTIAAGLASSLSETGDGNVLLVNMNSEDGEAHHFYKGKLTLGLDDVLEKEKRENALVQDNLYVVKESTNRDKLPSILPKRFSHLVTKMKASDYDYIIFDMPPVTQISITPRLARFMDMVLMVVEAGKTDADVAQRATTLLAESRANLGVVMNKSRSYVPKRLQSEL